jgi:gamma-glutamyl:cysteine ligase YbdK (ATP-grasp superfamily)
MSRPFGLFQRYGVELEYMLVESPSLEPSSTADALLREFAGDDEGSVTRDDVEWSNELVLHVVELKTAEPARWLRGLAGSFQREIGVINAALAPHGRRLLPTAMHPWLNPQTQTRLWPHAYNEVYATFDRIFGCRGHGWANLQSIHLNLPFANDEEFGRLHAAIRVLLPLMPALAASSPVCDGRLTGMLDSRLAVYATNAARVPSVSGDIVPEPVFTIAEYYERILERIYRDLAPLDPAGVLAHEWANARGAIARFERHTIEIRVLDIQECPAADLAIARLIVRTLQALVDECWCHTSDQQAFPTAPLVHFLRAATQAGDATLIDDPAYLRLLGITARGTDSGGASPTAGAVWRHLWQNLFTADECASDELAALRVIFEEGCLARRITDALGPEPGRERLHAVYTRLADCLASGTMFHASTDRS